MSESNQIVAAVARSATLNADGLLANITMSGNVTGNTFQIPVGTLLQNIAQVNPIIANLVLNSVLTYSDGNTLPVGSYGNPEGVTSPWAVYEFTTTPAPVLQVNDIISGAGVPVPSIVQWVGNTSGTDAANANIVVTSQTYTGLPTPVPGFGNTIYVTRQITQAGFDIATAANTSITLTPGANANIAIGASIIPLVNNAYDLGSPNARFRSIYFGGNTIYVYDPVLGVDQSISAYNGNLVVNGGTGLSVGQFTFYGNTIAVANPAEDIQFGKTIASGNVNFNRPITVTSNTYGLPTFKVSSLGRVQINPPTYIPALDAGALLISANTSGTYQPVNSAGGMLHLAGADGNFSIITNDTFGTGVYPLYVGRQARGTTDNPTATQANDVLLSFNASGRTDTVYGPTAASLSAIQFQAAENFSNTNAGTRLNFFTVPVGSNVRQISAQITSNGIVSNANVTANYYLGNGYYLTGVNGSNIQGNINVNNITSNSITFSDSSVQTTAFNANSAVTKITVGLGLTQTANVGNIGIDATGVQTVVSASNSQIIVADSGSKNLTLSLPQNISANSTVTFANLTITGNLTVAGNITSAGEDAINSKTLNLAANSTSNTQIDQGGIILGNANAAYAVSFLYDLTLDKWDTDGAGLNTQDLVAFTANVAELYANGRGHFGSYYQGYDYPNTAVQVDQNVNSYGQIVNQNHNNGTLASADFVAVNDIGDDDGYYVDLGINSSTYTDPEYSIMSANDSYLIADGGDFIVTTQTANSVIKFAPGNTTSSGLRVTIDNSGIIVAGNTVTSGNVQASYLLGNGAFITGLPAQYSNANVAAYLPTYTGNLASLTGNVTTTANLNSLGATITGNLTVTGNLINTPTFGYFWSNATQTAASTDTAYALTFNNTDGNSRVNLGTGASNSRVYINRAGYYNFNFSCQFDRTSGTSSANAYVWIRKNGSDIASTNSITNVDATDVILHTFNYLINAANVGDYFEAIWGTNSTTIRVIPTSANVFSGITPATPSVRLTISPVGA